MIKKITLGMVCGVLIPVFAFSGDRDAEKMARALEKYQPTGKTERCIRTNQIKSSQVFGDYHILFKMNGRKAYLNKLPRRCSRLGFERAFSYKLPTNRLCNIDLITVLDDISHTQGPSCGLGKFIEYEKKKKTEDTAE